MRKLFLTISLILCSGLAEARNSSFDEWWFSTKGVTSYVIEIILNNAYNTNLTSAVTVDITKLQGGTLSITNNGFGFNATADSTNINGILPWAVIRDTTQLYTNNWAVYNGDSSALTSYTTYTTNGGGGQNIAPYWDAATNARPRPGQSRLQGSTSVNSIVFDDGAWIDPQGSDKTITMQGGACIYQTGGTSYFAVEFNIRRLVLDFGTKEAIFHILGTLGHEVDTGQTGANMVGSGGVTKSGAGTLIFGYDGVSSGLKSYNMGNTGTFTINEGTVRAQSNNAGALGAGTLQLNGGVLDLRAGDTDLSYSRPVSMSNNFEFISNKYTNNTVGITYNFDTLSIGNYTLTTTAGTNVGSGTAGIAFTNAVTLTGAPIFNVTTNATAPSALTLSGSISGAYNIQKSGGGTLTLSGSNTYNNTYVNAGTLSVQNNNALPITSTLYVTNSAVVNLGSITNTIADLYLGGVQQTNGTHGSTSSTATFQNDTYFTGVGVLSVTNGL